MITTTFNFNDPVGFDFTDTEISGGVGKQTSPFQLEASMIMTESKKVRLFSAFAAVINEATPSHEVTFIVEDDGALKYWDGANWVASDGSAAQSSTTAEMNVNLPSLITDLTTHSIKFKIIFQSPDTTQTSELDSFSFTYVSGFNTCNVFVDLKGLLGTAPTIDASNPPKLYVSNDRGFSQGCNIVYPFSKSVVFNAQAEATLVVMETESTGEKLEFVITYPNGDSIDSFRFPPSVVPDVNNADLADIIDGDVIDPNIQIRVGSVLLPLGVNTRVINYSSPIVLTSHAAVTTLANLVDASPMLMPTTIIAKPNAGLTSKWSANTDSNNYSLEYLALSTMGATRVQGDSVSIANGVSMSNVVFSALGTTDYAVIAILTNIFDGSVQIHPVVATAKTDGSFIAKWSAGTDSANYFVDFVIRKNVSSCNFQGRIWQSGVESIASGVKQKSITFPQDIGTTQYALFGMFSNLVDLSPIIVPILPNSKATNGASFIWSANTDSINYKMEYIAVEV